ncbi:uncharacterized protein LOC131695697 [Topomyia yanbarensis]|uniref:uncharacterized protein LOC131695697 n=1 Tax=Topomyia yanbarensis TaxID=2498891 RepID=UPI00273B6242|nr:uncharacterized protein LOC131695697 [Topomyia yanbarensis]
MNAKLGVGSSVNGNLVKNLRNSEMRRSSAAGLTAASQRPPLPPKIETRCHSYDGLLGDDKKQATEGQDRVDTVIPTSQSTKDTAEPIKPTEESVKAKNRRSRSMDDLFDDDRDLANFLENTQSMENLQSETTPVESPIKTVESPVKLMNNICFNRRFVEPPVVEDTAARTADTASPELCYEQPCENETITIDNTLPVHSKAKEKSAPEDDVLSTNSSLNSFASCSDMATGSKKSNTPFINKYVKKVKSLMKK